MQINLELSIPLLKWIVLTLVLVCEYFKSTHGFVPGYSNGQTMKRSTSTRKMDSRMSMITRIASQRQALPVEQMDRYYVFFRYVFCI